MVVKRFMSRDDKSQPRTPMECDFQRQVVDDSELIHETIRPAVGSLLYASTMSRPDLAKAVRLVAQETEQPTRTVKGGIGRLKRTDDIGIVYRRSSKSDLQLEASGDAAFACKKTHIVNRFHRVPERMLYCLGPEETANRYAVDY
ncbi:hypothetical protein PF003_g10774 [Phytophthora fragariae]|nr:hypothetical protein PF003_g10774 [Phytophthora fragariae]